ncbi:MAG: alpha/beta hydrolase [Arachnia propionica]|nr:MAG: alpha/beta hydrolase [Arachnia propionica]
MKLEWTIFDPPAEHGPVLLLGASLGGNSARQWTPVARQLARRATVVFVDLPGHGASHGWDDDEPATLESVAASIVAVARQVRQRFPGRPLFFAGLSISGATALYLARDYAAELDGIAVVASAPKIGEPAAWHERAQLVAAGGTAQLVPATQQRWFSPQFQAEQPDLVAAIMADLAAADDHSYAQLCRALAVHDLRAELAGITLPALIIAGEADETTPLAQVRDLASALPQAKLTVLPGAAHQVPAAKPVEVAAELLEFCG